MSFKVVQVWIWKLNKYKGVKKTNELIARVLQSIGGAKKADGAVASLDEIIFPPRPRKPLTEEEHLKMMQEVIKPDPNASA